MRSHAENTIVISRSIEDVWAWLTHPDLSPQWPKIVAGVEAGDGWRFEDVPLAGIGATYVVVVEYHGMLFEGKSLKQLFELMEAGNINMSRVKELGGDHLEEKRTTVKVTRFVPLSRISFLVADRVYMTTRAFDLSPAGEGTQLSLSLERRVNPASRVHVEHYLLEDEDRMHKEIVEKALSELRLLLESGQQ